MSSKDERLKNLDPLLAKKSRTTLVRWVLTLILLGSSFYLAWTFFKRRRLRKAFLTPIFVGPAVLPCEEPAKEPVPSIILPSEGSTNTLVGVAVSVQEMHSREQVLPVTVLPSSYEYEYEKTLDPVDYEQERSLYPHVKVFPQQQDELLFRDRLPYDWRLAGASRRGYGHAYEGKYREDDFALVTQYFTPSSELSSKIIAETPLSAALIAIADGIGSKRYARYGAHAAVEGAISTLSRSASAQKNLEDLAGSLLSSLEIAELVVPLAARDLACAFLCQAMAQARTAVHEMAQQQGLSVAELRSTLLLLLVIPLSENHLFLASTQIGDGALFARLCGEGRISSDSWYALQRGQMQGVGHATVSLLDSSQETWQQYFQCGIYRDLDTVLGMTDGIANDIKPPLPASRPSESDPFAFVEDFYTQVWTALQAATSRGAALALNDLLSYRKGQSYDDRTLLCLYRKK